MTDWFVGQQQLANMASPLIKGDRAAFLRAAVSEAVGLAVPGGKPIAAALFDRLRRNRNTRLFEEYLEQQEDEERQAALLSSIGDALREIQNEGACREEERFVGIVRVVYDTGDRVTRQIQDVSAKIDRVQRAVEGLRREDIAVDLDAEDGYLTAFCLWFPVIRRLDRVCLDLMDARLYVLDPPETREQAVRQLADLDGVIGSYREAVRMVDRSWRRHGESVFHRSGGSRTWSGLVRAVSVAREFKPYTTDGVEVSDEAEDLRQAHTTFVAAFEDQLRRLTIQRDRLRSCWIRAEVEVRRRLTSSLLSVEVDLVNAATENLVQMRLLPYFDAVTNLMKMLRALRVSDTDDVPTFRCWADEELSPAVQAASQHVLWLCDSSSVELLMMAGKTLSAARTQALLDWLDHLLMFHIESIRAPVNQVVHALSLAYRGNHSSFRRHLANARRVVDENEEVWFEDFADYQNEAARFTLD